MGCRGVGWQDYKGKHYESVWTRYFEGQYLPLRLGYGRRRAHWTPMICSREMSRDEALTGMAKPAYEPELLSQDTQFVVEKRGLDAAEFERIGAATLKMATGYPSDLFSSERMMVRRNVFRSLATSP